MINSIVVKPITFIDKQPKTYQVLQELLSSCSYHPIGFANWKDEYPYAPQAQFKIAYSEEGILIQYDIEEEVLRAQYVQHNDAIWEDSCVEFFISFDENKNYYNFEFNPIGAGLIGYGPEIKSERHRLSVEEINCVKVFSTIERRDNTTKWNVIQYIPYEVFKHNKITASFLKDKNIFANFYKCGDRLPKPHFMSWNKIDHPTPNFHLTRYFGKLQFA